MANRDPEHDDKYYVDEETGERPDIAVALLSLVEAPDVVCEGLAIPGSREDLALLDLREVNYRRVEVTDSVDGVPAGRVWTYVGLPRAERCFRTALAAQRVFVPSEFREFVDAAFRRAGPDRYARYRETTLPPPCPERPLRLVRAGDSGT
jgi:hypothetical protein